MTKPQEKPWQSVGLLMEAARPERAHLIRGGLWLIVAAALEAVAPILGKRYIDHHLLPGHYDLAAMAGAEVVQAIGRTATLFREKPVPAKE